MNKKSKKKAPQASPKRPASQTDVARTLIRPTSFARGDLKAIGLLAVLALAVRLTFFFINKSSNPLFDHLVLDALFHNEWADDILNQSFWGNEVYFRAPFYAYFVAGMHAMSGASLAFAILAQHILGVGTVLGVYAIARHYFASNVAFVAGVIGALYWPLIYFEGELLVVTLFVFIATMMLLVLANAIKRQSTIWFIAAGTLLGLAAVTRPSVLIVAPVLPLVFRWSDNTPGRRWLRPTILVGVAALLVISPVLIRNFVVGKDFVPIASQGGVNFFIGNNAESNGTQAIVPGIRPDLQGTYRGAIAQAEQETGRSLKPSQVSNHFFRKGVDFIVLSPGDATVLTFKKFYYFWAAVERANNKYIQFFWREYGLGRAPLPGFWFVGPLGLLGGILLWRRRREFSLLYVFVIVYSIGVIAFFVNGRFRLPVMPVMIMFAAYALMYLYTAFRRKEPGLFMAIGALAVTTAFVNYDYMNFRGFRAFDEAITHYELGNAYMEKEKTDQALAEFEAAYEISTRYPTRGFNAIADYVDFQIGALYWEKGLYARAIEALERVGGDNAEIVRRGKLMLADAYTRRGRPQDAARTYVALLQQSPNDVQTQIGLATALRATGDLDRSLQILQPLAQQEGQHKPLALLEAARTLERMANYDAAEQYYQQASQDRFARRDALLDLARMYVKTDKLDAAGAVFSQLNTEYPQDPTVQAEVRGFAARQ